MSDLTSFPSLQTMHSWELPEPPFHWKEIGPLEYLFDCRGRQIFQGYGAVWRAIEPAHHSAEGQGDAKPLSPGGPA